MLLLFYARKEILKLTGDQESVLQKIIKSVSFPPILSLPLRGLAYSVDTDASDYQVGAVLFQTDEEDFRRPLGFWSIATYTKMNGIVRYTRRHF